VIGACFRPIFSNFLTFSRRPPFSMFLQASEWDCFIASWGRFRVPLIIGATRHLFRLAVPSPSPTRSPPLSVRTLGSFPPFSKIRLFMPLSYTQTSNSEVRVMQVSGPPSRESEFSSAPIHGAPADLLSQPRLLVYPGPSTLISPVFASIRSVHGLDANCAPSVFTCSGCVSPRRFLSVGLCPLSLEQRGTFFGTCDSVCP